MENHDWIQFSSPLLNFFCIFRRKCFVPLLFVRARLFFRIEFVLGISQTRLFWLLQDIQFQAANMFRTARQNFQLRWHIRWRTMFSFLRILKWNKYGGWFTYWMSSPVFTYFISLVSMSIDFGFNAMPIFISPIQLCAVLCVCPHCRWFLMQFLTKAPFNDAMWIDKTLKQWHFKVFM